jgi:hypothetical protein
MKNADELSLREEDEREEKKEPYVIALNNMKRQP